MKSGRMKNRPGIESSEGFGGAIPWMIEIAAILSAVVQKWDDFIIVTVMLVVNACLDFFPEHRAINALQALKQ